MSLRHDVTMSRRWKVVTSRRHHVATLERRDVGVFDSNVMSSHFRSHHVALCHIVSHHVTTFDANVATLDANVVTLLEIYEQRHEVGHERRDVAGFSSNQNDAKIQYLGLLQTSKLFLLHINHLRSSHDHILQERHWI